MKAALNGCLNLSILDGWWDEMYDGAQRLGDPHRRRRRRPRPPRRPRGRARSTTSSRTSVAPLFYDRDARRAAAPLDRDGAAHAADRSARRCWPAGWCATTSSSSTRRPPRRRGARSTDRLRRGARTSPPGRTRVRTAGRGPGRPREASGVGDAPELGQTADAAGHVVARRADARRRRGRRSLHGAVDDARPSSRRRPRSSSCGGRGPDGRRPTATTAWSARPAGLVRLHVRVLPSHPLLAAPPRWTLVAVPTPAWRRGRRTGHRGASRRPAQGLEQHDAARARVTASRARARVGRRGVARRRCRGTSGSPSAHGGRPGSVNVDRVGAGVQQQQERVVDDALAARRPQASASPGDVHARGRGVGVEPVVVGHLARRPVRTRPGPWRRRRWPAGPRRSAAGAAPGAARRSAQQQRG